MAGITQQWWDSDLPSERRRSLTLWTTGQLTYSERPSPAHVWSPPQTLYAAVALSEARIIAERIDLSAYLPREPEPESDSIGTNPENEPCYFIAYGLAGYGPHLEPDDASVPLSSLDYALESELTTAADSAEERAHALADEGWYAEAWNAHVLAEELTTLAANVSPRRRTAPLYADDVNAWLSTLRGIIVDTFPVDVGENERLYVWLDESGDNNNEG